MNNSAEYSGPSFLGMPSNLNHLIFPFFTDDGLPLPPPLLLASGGVVPPVPAPQIQATASAQAQQQQQRPPAPFSAASSGQQQQQEDGFPLPPPPHPQVLASTAGGSAANQPPPPPSLAMNNEPNWMPAQYIEKGGKQIYQPFSIYNLPNRFQPLCSTTTSRRIRMNSASTRAPSSMC
jgi:hypothetical protein